MTRYEVELTNEQAEAICAMPGPGEFGIESSWWSAIGALADAIRSDLPRMTEPDWGEKVIAHTITNDLRRQFLRFLSAPHSSAPWIDISRDCYPWGSLIDPEPAS